MERPTGSTEGQGALGIDALRPVLPAVFGHVIAADGVEALALRGVCRDFRAAFDSDPRHWQPAADADVVASRSRAGQTLVRRAPGLARLTWRPRRGSAAPLAGFTALRELHLAGRLPPTRLSALTAGTALAGLRTLTLQLLPPDSVRWGRRRPRPVGRGRHAPPPLPAPVPSASAPLSLAAVAPLAPLTLLTTLSDLRIAAPGWSLTDAVLGPLTHLPWLDGLAVDGAQVAGQARGLTTLWTLTRLTKLTLSNLTATAPPVPEGTRGLEGIAGLHRLRALTLAELPSPWFGPLVAAAPPGVHALTIERITHDDTVVAPAWALALQHLTDLRRLEVDDDRVDCGWTPSLVADAVADMAALTSLQVTCEAPAHPHDLEALARLTGLRKLQLSAWNDTMGLATVWTALAPLSRLQEGAWGAGPLSRPLQGGARFPQLASLSIEVKNRRVPAPDTEETVAHLLAAVAGLPALTHLRLDFEESRRLAAEVLAPLAAAHRLRSLCLDHGGCTLYWDGTLPPALSALTALTRLAVLLDAGQPLPLPALTDLALATTDLARVDSSVVGLVHLTRLRLRLRVPGGAGTVDGDDDDDDDDSRPHPGTQPARQRRARGLLAALQGLPRLRHLELPYRASHQLDRHTLDGLLRLPRLTHIARSPATTLRRAQAQRREEGLPPLRVSPASYS